MTVAELLEKIQDIVRLDELYAKNSIHKTDLEDLISLVMDYKEELLKKKVI